MVPPNDTQIGDVKETRPLVGGFFAIHASNYSGHLCGLVPPLCEVGQAAMLAIKIEGFGFCVHSQGAANPILQHWTNKRLMRRDDVHWQDRRKR
jgi:hypothetical protein